MTAHQTKQSKTYMKSIIVFLAVAVAAPQTIYAQGTIYLSNLDQPSQCLHCNSFKHKGLFSPTWVSHPLAALS